MAADDEVSGRDGDREDARDERDERDESELSRRPSGARQPAVAAQPGFFHIYKSGQGYWTRISSVGGAGLIILLTASFFYTNLPVWSTYLAAHKSTLIGLCVGIMAALSILTFWIFNRPGTVDFLIATDSEMKKVNWTSKADLIGSTKVVILFMFLITALLFVFDILFGYVFYIFKVLRQPPI